MTGRALLGISALSHNAAVATIAGDTIRFAAESERYTRVKNDSRLCDELIEDACQYGIPATVVYYERPLIKRLRHLAAGQYAHAFSTRPATYLRRFATLRDANIVYIDHHYAHAAGGYFTSPFRDAAVVVVDAIGEWNTLTVWRAAGRKLRKIHSVDYPDSVGLLYSAFTQWLGFKPNEEEFIVMGMAATGVPEYTDLIRREFLQDLRPPHFRLRQSVHRGLGEWMRHLTPANVAASIQVVVEEFLLGLFEWVARTCGSKNLVYSGGVALNCVANEKIARRGLFDDIWILPSPGDGGSSVGAALAHRGEWVEWPGAYLGKNIDRPLDVDAAVTALESGEVIGIANGRAEFGPRALGARSLLADPRPADTKDRVNAVKKREPFRPFSPIVMAEHAADHFDMPLPSIPYMQFTARSLEPDRFPAICHVDGSSRVQTLTHAQNPVMYSLLEEFHRRTGCPMLLNTSLNVKGEPLVNTWTDALRFSELNRVRVF